MEAKFLSIGLNQKTVKSTLKNKKLSSRLDSFIALADPSGEGLDSKIGRNLYALATKYPENKVAEANQTTVVRYVLEGKLSTTKQVGAATKFLKKAKAWDQNTFDSSCGVGVVITTEQIEAAVTRVLTEHKEQVLKQRYSCLGRLLGILNKELMWGDGKTLKSVFDAQVLALLGPKDHRDKKKKKKGKQKQKEKKEEKKEEPDEFRKSGRVIPEWSENTEKQQKTHEKTRPYNIVTRFPPEPNGFLHIGHAKAMNFNFGVAEKSKGGCIMRFDDTNPTAEKKLYIDSILENIHWMGYKPFKTTYSSDYFQELYDLAVLMIKKGYAYVCHQTGAEIEASRKPNPCIPSPFRTRSVAENLRLFEDMRKGKYDEGEATLRMKGDLASPNPQMWDLVAYRIMYHAHPMSGDAWCVYPSYDYTHCIVDSLENITHSLCTLEFEMRRESYFWLLWVLDLYKPKVWEYSRLNIQYNVLSKRKLIKLVTNNLVRGWDDPRLLTINGLRRRGFSAEALKAFCNSLGVTRNANAIPWHVLEHYLRADLEPKSKRAYCVADPIKVTIVNWPEGKEIKKTVPNHPSDAKFGSRTVYFTREVYIDRSDFRVKDSKNYFGLAPGKEVHLKYGFNVKCLSHTLNDDGSVRELKCSYNEGPKAKAKIHWVSATPARSIKVELRLYDHLFSVKEPGTRDGVDWLTELNPQSEVIATGVADLSIADATPGTLYQFERVGYFVCDQDSREGHVVFNRCCPLKMKAQDKAAVRR